MKEFLLTCYDAIERFSDAYGLYVIALGIGILITAGFWFHKHPEDFYTVEDENADETR